MPTPLEEFKDRLEAFATGQKRGIRNPFVMVPVEPEAEQKAASRLQAWADKGTSVPVETVYLDRVMPQTDVFQTVVGLPDEFFRNGNGKAGPKEEARPKEEEQTLKDNLAEEVVSKILETKEEAQRQPERILLLLHLGALYPFARSSKILDEMERRGVRATIGVLFPGKIIDKKLSFFGERARHYYPAHQIERRITTDQLQ